ncbi:MAG: fibronectin type III domain-containing protein [Muribaculaceae bacterium]|nr:fibronectin type III domain-containing protein [Muribaculaceae bacterium]
MKKYRHSIIAKLCCLIFMLGTMTPTTYAADHNIWPERVTDFTTEWDSSTGYVTVKLTAPTNSMTSMGSGNGDPLPYLTKILLSRNLNYGDYIEVHTFENPAPGEQLTFIDTTVGEGLIQYKAVAYIDDYASYPEWSEIEIGQKPVDINDAYATCDKGNAPVTIYFTAPLLDTNGDTLKALESIEVSKYSYDSYQYELIGSVDNPTPGEACSFSDSDVVSGESYSYRLVACTTAGKSYGTVVNVMVGHDTPMSPTNVQAKVSTNKVYIEWEAPQKGQTNGYIDISELRYTVLRSTTSSEYDAVVLEEGVTQISYADYYGELDKETKFTYFVRAANAQGESIGAPSNAVVVGPPSALPFIETFDSTTTYSVPTTDHAGWTFDTTETACAWFVSEEAILEDCVITTENDKGGLAYASYGSYNDLSQDDYMTSGKIRLSDAYEPLLKFRYYAFTGFNSTLAIEISTDGGDWKQVDVIDYQGLTQMGWQSYTKSLYNYVAPNIDYIQVRLHAHKGTYACPVIIDSFIISDLPMVENLSYDDVNNRLSWDAPQASEYLELTGYEVAIFGGLVAQLPADTTEYDYSYLADEGVLMFGIIAVYEGVYRSKPKGIEAVSIESVDAPQAKVYVADGTLHVIASENTPIEVYTLDGQCIAEAKGNLAITLPQGIYIVKTDNLIHKALIK